MSERTHTVSIRMTAEELEMLHEVAEAAGLNQSDWARQRIRSEHATLLGEKKARRKRTRKK